MAWSSKQSISKKKTVNEAVVCGLQPILTKQSIALTIRPLRPSPKWIAIIRCQKNERLILFIQQNIHKHIYDA